MENPPCAGKCKPLYKISSLLKDTVRTDFVPDVTAEAVSVAIAAPPSEGEANAELCRYLSKVLELRKSDVVLDKVGLFGNSLDDYTSVIIL